MVKTSEPLTAVLDYKIIRSIGKGGFSEVFLAQKDGRDFAVKLMSPPKGMKADDVLQSLRYEFWVLKDLLHPNIVRVFDFGQLADGRIFIVEEFLQGPTLDTFCFKRPFEEVAPLFLQVFGALKAIHSWKIIHGDIKTKNIMVVETSSGPEAKVLDFGLARPLGESSPADKVFRGTPATIAPEIILKERPDARSDLYSVGVTFYECLRSKNPFVGPSLDVTLKRHLQEMAESIGLFRNDVPPAWARLIQRLLVKNPAHRIQSASQALSLLSESHFVLNPTLFVGRKKELGCVEEIMAHLKSGKKLAVVVGGEPGVGRSRFIKEVFYQVISRDPAAREKIAMGPDAVPVALVLLLEAASDLPAGFESQRITLEPLSKPEVREWLEQIFSLEQIPEVFLQQLMALTRGLPKLLWDLLLLLQQKGLLADAGGRVTKSSLFLIKWDEVIARTEAAKDFSETFEYLYEEIRKKVRLREMTADHPLWKALDAAVQKTADVSEQLVRKARLMSLKGASLIDLSQFPQARQFLTTALEILDINKTFKIDVLKIKNYLAYIELRQGRVEEAIRIYEEVRAEMLKKLDVSERREIRNNDLGVAYLQAGQWQKAFETLSDDVKCFEESGMQEQKVGALYNMGQAAFHLEKLEEAADLYKQTIEVARATQNTAFLLRAFNGLGNVLNRQERWSEAIVAYSEALELALALRDFTSAMAAVQNRGVLKGQHGQFEEAIQDLELSLRHSEKIPQKFAYEKTLACRSLLELGEIYQKRAQLEESRAYLDKAWYQAENDADLAGFRFWVLKSRAQLWLAMQKWEDFKQDLSQLNYFATDETKKKTLSELKARYQESRQQGDFTEREIRLERELETILKINRDLVGEMSLEELLKRILGFAIELSKSELGVILLADDKGRLRPRLSLNADLDQDLSEISLSVAEKVLKTGQIVKTADAAQDSNFNQYSSVMSLNLKSILGIPIVFKGQVLGVLYLSHRYQVGLFDEKNTRVILSFADQVGLALKNHQLLDFYRKTNESLADELEATQLSLTRAQEKLKSGQAMLTQMSGGKSFVTRSPHVMEIVSQLERVANTNLSVVIHGESGTGKEILARYIHEVSKQHKHGFVAINCGALPANLVESELFGHKRGAFTGADHDKIGLIEAAHQGTLFLDEVTDLSPEIQVKLLRVLQERELVRLGETVPRPVELRVLAASHKNLREAVQKKVFREDLYYRLAGMEVILPPLRERPEDVILLAEHYLKVISEQQGRNQPEKIAPELVKLMLSYAWPGNIRELKNFIEVGLSLCEGKVLRKEHFPQYLVDRMLHSTTLEKEDGTQTATPAGWYDPRKTWKEHEVLIYASALCHLEFDPLRVAKSLKVGVATVYKWMREHRFKETRDNWADRILPYEEGLGLDEIRAHVFKLAAERHPGHPYHAARELGVAPVTFYRWSQS